MAFVELEKKGAVGVITMNRPEALNALNDQVLRDLDEVLDQGSVTKKSWWLCSPAQAAPLWPGPTSARCPISPQWKARRSASMATRCS